MLVKVVNKTKIVILFAVFFVTSSQAQTAVCSLQINTFELETNGKFSGKPIENVKAVLTDTSSKKEFNSSFLTKYVLFANLIPAEYSVEIAKDGYQKRLKNINLDCDIANETDTVLKNIFLQKGSSKEFTKFNHTKFVLDEKKLEDSRSSEMLNNNSVNGKATGLATPIFPAAAKAVRAFGEVKVEITIDEDGDVVTAEARSGHPLLRAAAEKAAKKSSFSPTILDKQPVMIVGIIIYNFRP